MAETDKNSFLLYIANAEQFAKLTDAQAGKLIKGIFSYVENHIVPDFKNSAVDMAFSFIKQYIDKDQEKWKETREKRIEAGRKGGKQSQANRANASFAKQNQANQAVSEYVSVSVSESVYDINNIPPKSPKEEMPPKQVISDSAAAHKQKYGEYRHVALTSDQYNNLVSEYGKDKTDLYIKKIDEWVQLKGKPYKDYNLAVRNWLNRDNESKAKSESEHSYDLDDFKSLVNSFGGKNG